MKHSLHPPLTLIEADLRNAKRVHVEEPPLDDEEEAGPDMVVPEVPPYLLDLIKRKVASQAAFPPQPLAVGQIRRISSIYSSDGSSRQLGRSCGVLLQACLGGQRWSGWVVAQEADYAGERDLVLQENDGVLDLDAAMVQTWNPVELLLRGDEELLGKLSSERLGAVIKLADWHAGPNDEFTPSRPGRIGAWDLDEHTIVVTGTPVRDKDDPRVVYRRLYAELSAELRVAATPVAPSKQENQGKHGSILAWIRRPFLSPGWAIAGLMALVFQGMWLSGAISLGEEEERYRGSAQGGASGGCTVSVKIQFKPGVSYSDVVTRALRPSGASIYDGPSEHGEIWVKPPHDLPAKDLAAMLEQSGLVENADVVEPDRRLCK